MNIKKIQILSLLLISNFLFTSISAAEELSDLSDLTTPSDTKSQGPADPDVSNVEGMLESNMPMGSTKNNLPSRVNKTPAKVNFSSTKELFQNRDTVIIQKTYMPKTSRFQVFGGGSLSMNDVFYRTYGADIRLGFHFSEAWGLEFNSFFLTSSDSQEKKDLADKQSLSVQNLSTPKGFYGANIYFNSIYGKVALEDRKILPFEFYQTAGIGQMTTTPTSTSSAFYLGLGNLFSISKNSLLRVDLSWYFYNTKTIKGDTMNANTLFLTFGIGTMLPGVERR